LYDQALDTMRLEHVNHFEREGVLPIAFSLFHIVNMMDASFMLDLPARVAAHGRDRVGARPRWPGRDDLV